MARILMGLVFQLRQLFDMTAIGLNIAGPASGAREPARSVVVSWWL